MKRKANSVNGTHKKLKFSVLSPTESQPCLDFYFAKNSHQDTNQNISLTPDHSLLSTSSDSIQCSTSLTSNKPVFSNPNGKNAFDILLTHAVTSIKSQFYLEYRGKNSLGRHIWKYHFTDSLPYHWISKVHSLKVDARRVIDLSLATNLHMIPYSLPNLPSHTFCKSMLKSILQKNVRLARVESSLRTALQLGTSFSMHELTRRVCVIVLEDTLLHPDYPLLSWCMACGKELIYSRELIETIFQIISDVSSVQYRDFLHTNTDIDIFDLYKQGHSITRSILIRSLYRGLKGDVTMLNVRFILAICPTVAK